MGSSRNVVLTGFHPHPEQLIALADVCLLASAREGLPRVLMQYLAGGRPVVAADLPCIADVLRDGVNGVVIGSDLAGLADAVITLLDDSARRSRLARGAAATELSEWDAVRMGERLEAVYAEVLRERMPQRTAEATGGVYVVNALLAAAVLSLMLPIRMETGLILVRPFEFLIALGMLGWPLIAARRGVRVPVGLLLLLPYLTWHVVSATVGGPRNTVREALQVFVVTMFAFLVAQEAPRLDMKRFSRRLLLGIGAIALGTIVWHVAHGYWVGWKQIPDPRLSFVFLPVVLAGLILFAEAEKRRSLHFVWAGLFPVLLLSGERKALVIYLILSALLFARGRLALIVPALAAAFVGLLLLSTVVENPYLQKQIRTLVEPGGTGNYEYVLATGRYLPGDTPSDVQRAFALHVSSQMFAEHPLFGVGTNQYEAIVGETYPNAPEEHASRDPRRVPADPDGERIGRFLPLRC